MKNYLASLLIFIIILGFFIAGVGSVSNRADEEGLVIVEDAIRRATVQCYAIEGAYPVSLDYLEQNYGLRIDEKKYFVHYSPWGSNMMPDITVMRRDFIDE